MDIEAALKIQYHAGLDMLKLAIEGCPEPLWTAGSDDRPFWRIAFHALFYTHWYLEVDHKDLVRWELDEDGMARLWEKPPSGKIYSKEQLLAYWQICKAKVDGAVDAMHLSSSASGFPWYPISKMEHQLVNLRHLQHHVGQLTERLLEAGVEVDWLGGYRDQ